MLGLALAPTVSRALSVLHTGHGASLASATLTAPQHHDCDEPATSQTDDAAGSAEAAPASNVPMAHPGGHGDHGNGASGNHDHLNHCPLCGVAATAWTVAPAAARWNGVEHGVARHAAVAGDAIPQAATPWSVHQPRGPPSQA